jgi:3D (Asp-Asp-Asp) domain-containing protein
MVDGPNVYGYVGYNPIDDYDGLGLCKTVKNMLVTAYTGRATPTASGVYPHDGTVAVGRKVKMIEIGKRSKKPKRKKVYVPVYPFGSIVKVRCNDGSSYDGKVEDTGRGDVVHKVPKDSWIDVWFKTKKAALDWGVKHCRVTIKPPPGAQ